jgi:7,8-dihydropterin-6-yl-methyl-4-(beta-D-ribofuranosyl)aminobenzene 5'-phosphate synthase
VLVSLVRSVTITVLVENSVEPAELIAEHGLAFWIEADGRAVLFDTGQGYALPHNAAALRIDPRRAEAIALSHGHFDHTGGLPCVVDAVDAVDPVPVYAHPAALEPKYKRREDGSPRPIGMPEPARAALGRMGGSVSIHTGPVDLVPGVWLTGEVPRDRPSSGERPDFFLDPAMTRPDRVLDDQSLVIDTAGGTVVVLGCTHAGVENTLEHVRRLRPGRRIRAVLGGMHLLHAAADEITAAVDYLAALEPDWIAAGHCTGRAAMRALDERFGDRSRPCQVGERFAIA